MFYFCSFFSFPGGLAEFWEQVQAVAPQCRGKVWPKGVSGSSWGAGAP